MSSILGSFDQTMSMLQKVLDLRSQKQLYISSNIANANTPGYSPVRMEFQDRLQDALSSGQVGLKATNAKHIAGAGRVENVQAEVYRERSESDIGDQNAVSVDKEMMELSQNQIRYEAAIQMLNKKMAFLRYVIQESV